ncbi:MAG: DUF2332 family protein [Alphaproteobacteria bacterium]|nr:DUF2332 family protein [Alphaproteobacteria bacterium]
MHEVFEYQAKACAELGSPFTARVLRIASRLLKNDTPVSQRILNWPGDPSSGADSVPLRLAGALHSLVLSGQYPDLERLYPPNPSDDTALSSTIKTAFTTHSDHILHWLNSPPQTNESGRSAPLVAAAHMLVAKYNLPLRLLELGTSAGLNLRWDHVALDLQGRLLGLKNARMTLTPDWQGVVPETRTLEVISRAGVDLNPLDPTSQNDRLRLLSYIWPDQPDRLRRMKSALDLARDVPACIEKSDAIDWLETQLATPHTGALTVIFNTVAWQYFPPEKQKAGLKLIEAHGRRATRDRPLAWLSMENDGATPGAGLTLRLWPGAQTISLGRADFHGRWVRWDIGATLPAA